MLPSHSHSLDCPISFDSIRSAYSLTYCTYIILILSLSTTVPLNLIRTRTRFPLPFQQVHTITLIPLPLAHFLTPSPSRPLSSVVRAVMLLFACVDTKRGHDCVLLIAYAPSCRIVLYIFYKRTAKSPRSYHRSRRILTQSTLCRAVHNNNL